MKKSQQYKEGEYIYLCWDGLPEWYAVRGHINADIATKVVNDEAFFADGPDFELELTGYLYARFEPAPPNNDMGVKQYLKLHNHRGRGLFPVTILNIKEGA